MGSKTCRRQLLQLCNSQERWLYVCDSCNHISSAGPVCTVPIVTLSLLEPHVDVINGALTADEPLKVVLDLQTMRH